MCVPPATPDLDRRVQPPRKGHAQLLQLLWSRTDSQRRRWTRHEPYRGGTPWWRFVGRDAVGGREVGAAAHPRSAVPRRTALNATRHRAVQTPARRARRRSYGDFGRVRGEAVRTRSPMTTARSRHSPPIATRLLGCPSDEIIPNDPSAGERDDHKYLAVWPHRAGIYLNKRMARHQTGKSVRQRVKFF